MASSSAAPRWREGAGSPVLPRSGAPVAHQLPARITAVGQRQQQQAHAVGQLARGAAGQIVGAVGGRLPDCSRCCRDERRSASPRPASAAPAAACPAPGLQAHCAACCQACSSSPRLRSGCENQRASAARPKPARPAGSSLPRAAVARLRIAARDPQHAAIRNRLPAAGRSPARRRGRCPIAPAPSASRASGRHVPAATACARVMPSSVPSSAASTDSSASATSSSISVSPRGLRPSSGARVHR